jgi:hypothetical protein
VKFVLIAPDVIGTLPGFLPGKKKLHMPRESNIVPSVIQKGLALDDMDLPCPYTITKKPAVLGGMYNEECSIYENRLLTFSKISQPGFSVQFCNWMTDKYIFLNMISDDEFVRKKRIFSFKQGLFGIRDYGNFGSLDWQTSWGYYCNLLQLKTDDLIIFTDDTRTDGKVSEIFQKNYDQIGEKLVKNKVPANVVSDTLKDELRDLEKVLTPRLFAAGSKAMAVWCRQYFGDYVVSLEKDVRTHCVKIGLNPHSAQWKYMYDRMLEVHEPKFIAGDVEKWDVNCCLRFIDHFNEHLGDVYGTSITAEERKYQYLLLRAMFQAYHLSPKGFYRKTRGMPSGHYLTSIVNSILNRFYHMMLWFVLVPSDYRYRYFDLVRDNFYGDDSLCSVDKVVQKYYNMQSIAHGFKEYFNMNYTSPRKEEQMSAFVPIEEVQFLKRGFRFQNGHVFPILEQESIKQMVLWIDTKTKQPERYTIWQSSLACQVEWFYWGRELYNHHIPILNLRLRALFGCNPKYQLTLTYEQMLARWSTQAYIC